MNKRLRKENKNFLLLIDQNADGIIVVDSRGIIRYINNAAVKLFGHNKEELLGEVFGFPISSTEKTEIEIVTSSHKIRTGELNVVDIEWEGDSAYLVSIRDITERKKTEDEVKEKNQILSGIIDNVPLLIFRINEKGIITESLGSGLKNIGLDNTTLIGVDILKYDPTYETYFHKALAGEKIKFIIDGEFNNKPYFFEIHMFFDSFKGKGVIGFGIDITERMLMERQIRRNELVIHDITTYLKSVEKILEQNKP